MKVSAMKRFFTTKKGIAVASIVTLAVVSGGIGAYAYWTTGGTGTGTATTGSAQNTTVAAAFPVISDLGVTVTATSATIHNNSSTASVNVAGKNLSIVSADCSGGVAPATVGVPLSWFTLGGTAAPSATIAPSATVSFPGPVTLTLNNDPTVNQDTCQGASVTLHLALI